MASSVGHITSRALLVEHGCRGSATFVYPKGVHTLRRIFGWWQGLMEARSSPGDHMVLQNPAQRSSNPPTHLYPSSIYTTNPFRRYAMQHWPTPPLETGRHLTGTWKDGGRGSCSHLIRAFAGSKPLLIASLPTSGHTVLTLILPRRRMMGGCTKQDRQPERPPPHTDWVPNCPALQLRLDLPTLHYEQK